MKTKKLSVVLAMLIIFMLVAGVSYAQTVKKHVLKKPIVKKQNLTLKNYYLSGTVFEINCNDGYIKIYDSKCKIYTVGIKSTKCNRLNLSSYDRVKITYKRSFRPNSTQIRAIKVKKIKRSYLKGKIKVVNCNDGYIEITYRLCRKTVNVRVGVSRNECVRYNLNANDTVKVYGNVSYSDRNRRFEISNVSNIIKL